MASHPACRKGQCEEVHSAHPLLPLGFLCVSIMCQTGLRMMFSTLMGGRALTMTPATRVLLYLSKRSSPLEPLDPRSKNALSHLEGSSQVLLLQEQERLVPGG